MAKVLEVDKIQMSGPLQYNNYGGGYYNGYIYFLQGSVVYKYDYINDVKDVYFSLPTIYSGPTLYYNGRIYYYSAYNKIAVFDIENKTITEASTGPTYGYNKLAVVNNYLVALRPYVQNYDLYAYRYNLNTLSGGNYYSGDWNGTAIIYYIQQNHNSDDFLIFGQDSDGDISANTLTKLKLTQSNLSPSSISLNESLQMDGSSTFIKDGILYIVGGKNKYNNETNNFYKFDPSTNIVEKINIDIPAFSFRDAVETPQGIYIFLSDGILRIREVEYNLTYSIKDNQGALIAEYTNRSPITSIRFGFDGNTISYRLNTLSEVISGTYTPQEIEGYRINGFTDVANSKSPIFLLNQDIDISINTDYTFYETYGTYRPPATTFNINLYQNSAEVNRVDKEEFLEEVGTLSGALREECSMLTPSIVYQSESVPTFNYVYIPIFNRYYFVTSLSSVNKNVWRMELNCDVLMTYKNEILLLEGVIGRQESDFNPLLVDNELPTQNNPIVEVIDIPSETFDTQTTDNKHNFLLTVIGA